MRDLITMRDDFLAKAADYDLVANHAARERKRHGQYHRLARRLRKTIAHIDQLVAMYEELRANAADCDFIANHATEEGTRNTYRRLAKALRRTTASIDQSLQTPRNRNTAWATAPCGGRPTARRRSSGSPSRSRLLTSHHPLPRIVHP